MTSNKMQTETSTNILSEIQTKGYCVIPNVLSKEEIDYAKRSFYEW